MINVEDFRKLEKLVEDIFLCTTAEQVEKLFDIAGITRPAEKYAILQTAMKIEWSSPPHFPMSAEDLYSDELMIFEEGSWRLLA
jgi:hypothetical protein